jgi:digeranylgeranylglycerophospholipid reductase
VSRQLHDIIIIGGGPGGLATSRLLAREGFDVVLFEEHPSSGEPVHCTGVLAAEAFDDPVIPRDVILNPLRTVRFFAPNGAAISHTTETTEAVVVDRAALDRALFSAARDAGVQLLTGRRATNVSVEADGVTVTLGDGATVRARACVLACGAQYSIQRKLGLGMPAVFLQSAQVEVPADSPGDVEVRFGQDVAPGGFAWTVPVMRPSGPHARIGLMCDREASRYFDRLLETIAPSWGVSTHDDSGARLVSRNKMLPLAPIPRTFTDRVLAVGDAAGLVKATTGGGIFYSLLSAGFAAEVLASGLRTDRLGSSSLKTYEKAWKARLGPELKAQLRLRLLSQRLEDDDVDAFFELARTDGVMPIVRRTARFNQHRDVILSLLRHPPARRVLLRRILPRAASAAVGIEMSTVREVETAGS